MPELLRKELLFLYNALKNEKKCNYNNKIVIIKIKKENRGSLVSSKEKKMSY